MSMLGTHTQDKMSVGCGKMVTFGGIQKWVCTNCLHHSYNFLVLLKLCPSKGVRPDPTPKADLGPYQAAAGLPCVGLHLLPVFLRFLDNVFVGHAWGRGGSRYGCP